MGSVLGDAFLPEKAFSDLFGTARVLLRDKVTEEAMIVPTLAFAAAGFPAELWKELLIAGRAENDSDPMLSEAARGLYNHISKDFAGSSLDWSYLAREFSDFYSARPVTVVDGVVLLRRESVWVESIYESPVGGVPCEVAISVLQGSKTPSPETVAEAYRHALSEDGVPWIEESSSPIRTEHLVSKGNPR
jgi:hypothetical protein